MSNLFLTASLDCNVSGGTAFSVHQRKREKTSTNLLTSGKNAEELLMLSVQLYSVHKPKLQEMVKISQCIQFRLEHQSGKHLLKRTSIIHTNPQRRVFQVNVVILQCSQTDQQKSSSFQKNKHSGWCFSSCCFSLRNTAFGNSQV